MDDLSALSEIVSARREVVQSKMAQLLAIEERLRDALQATKQPSLAAREMAFQNSGASLVWDRWVAMRREQLNIELAQVLAQKADLAATLRVATGKEDAVHDLAAKQREAATREATKHWDQNLQSLSIFATNPPPYRLP